MATKQAHTKLNLAVFVTVLTAFVFVFLFVYIGISTRKYTYEDSKIIAKEISRKAATETEIYLSSALMITRSMEQKLKFIRRGKLGREAVIDVLKTSLVRNPNFLSAWTIWEPNAFDGKDSYYKNDTSLYDANGSMSIGFFYYQNKLILEQPPL